MKILRCNYFKRFCCRVSVTELSPRFSTKFNLLLINSKPLNCSCSFFLIVYIPIRTFKLNSRVKELHFFFEYVLILMTSKKFGFKWTSLINKLILAVVFMTLVFFCFLFFSMWVFFHEHSRITRLQGKGEGISLTPHYHFHSLHGHLDISRAITAENLFLCFQRFPFLKIRTIILLVPFIIKKWLSRV